VHFWYVVPPRASEPVGPNGPVWTRLTCFFPTRAPVMKVRVFNYKDNQKYHPLQHCIAD
jgi:hypothetical protein